MKSCVRNQSILSDWFSVAQGTRQGGKSSPILYLLFVDGLIKELEDSRFDFCIYDLKYGSPTVADDMVLVSYSRYGLQNMLNICNSYSTKWRYEYNPLKCAVIVFNESKSIYNKCSRTWSLGDKQILEAENYTHLGINCNKYFNITNRRVDA